MGNRKARNTRKRCNEIENGDYRNSYLRWIPLTFLVAVGLLGTPSRYQNFNQWKNFLEGQLDRLREASVVRQLSMNDLVLHSVNATTLVEDDGPSTKTNFCSFAEVEEGQWVKKLYPEPHYLPASRHKQCPNALPGQNWTTWEWHPSASCEFARFDVDRFCQLAQNQTIAFVGDSITLDMYLSVTHLLGVPMALPPPRMGHVKLISQVCKTQNVTLIGQRDYFLKLIQDVATSKEHNVPNVLVLNRGAHYVDDNLLLHDMNNTVIPHILNWHQQCQLAYGSDRK
ncbi:expressed unknown protein [Seminavis robusta]|uniref:Trichome birefringence-like N-terminal domain-containing protein n=1 Tax=Seminavis robusta TaxID=568900 RepID=A0A9N8DX23_9STRA|nr:expressed unknown protein [Seminavis robusta]|eukprot:Sro346_g122680.1 n/a (284) ;mRNA; f:32256-33107